MSDFLRTALALTLTIAPLGSLRPFESLTDPEMSLPRAFVCSVAAFVLLAATAVIAEPLLEWIDVSPENFQLAAALIVLPHAFHLIVRGNSMDLDRPDGRGLVVWLFPLTIPLLVSPASVGATISYASRFGSGTAIASAGVVLGINVAILANAARLSGAAESRTISLINRFSGALLIALAVELAVDGIRSI